MTSEMKVLTASDTARAVALALEQGDESAAIRYLTEAVSRLIQAPSGADIPADAVAPPEPIQDVRYATLMATAFAYAMVTQDETPMDWMIDVEPLASEWLWDGDASTSAAIRALIRSDTPKNFLDKNILASATGSPGEREIVFRFVKDERQREMLSSTGSQDE